MFLNPPFIEFSFFIGTESVSAAWSRAKGGVAAAPTGGIAFELLRERGFVIVRSDGAEFSGPRGRRLPFGAGLAMYQNFLRWIPIVQPLYGAILVEYSLEEPVELLTGRASLAFRNWYLKHPEPPVGRIARIHELIRDAGGYSERIDAGTYFSLWPPFNPSRMGVVGSTSQWISAEIGRLLAEEFKGVR